MPGVSYTVTTDNASYDAPATNDTVAATGSNDTIRGGEGDDIVDGRSASGYVYLVGGATDPYSHGGSDTIYAGAHGSNIYTGPGYQAAQQADVASFAGHSLVYGGAGADNITSNDYTIIFAGQGNDHIVGQHLASTVYGGQGDDYISNVTGYISGDLGADTIASSSGTIFGGDGSDYVDASGQSLVFGNAGNDTLGAGSTGSSSTVYGGKGDDHIGSAYGINNYLSGDDGNDTIIVGSSSSSGDSALGGNGDDYVSVLHAIGFGNAGNDTLYASEAGSIFGGQGDDQLSANVSSGGGANFLSGDLGNDTLTSSAPGSDTLVGGAGADYIFITAHQAANGVTVLVRQGDSTANQGSSTGIGDESNLDHIAGFNFASDHIVVAGHATGTASNVTTYMDATANSSEATAFSAAYLYAYGDGTSAHTAHVGATEYLAVSESYAGTNTIYVFAADHTAVAFTGVSADSFQAGAIVGG